MNKKALLVVLSSIRHARNTIETMCCDDYPMGEFYDREYRDMYYQLNEMCISITGRIVEMEAAEHDQEES